MIRFKVFARTLQEGRLLALQLDTQRLDDGSRNLVLDREHVFKLTLVGLRPENVAGGYLNKVCRDPQPIIGLPHASSKNRVDFELPANLANVLGLSFKLENRGRCDHPHARSF